MAIAKMLKIRLMGINAYKDDILNAIHKTGCVELSATEELQDTFAMQQIDNGELSDKYERVKRVIEFLLERAEKAKKEPFYPEKDIVKYQFVSYEEFMNALEMESDAFRTMELAEEYERKILKNRTKLLKLNNLIIQLQPYLPVKEKFSFFKDTEKTFVKFGLIKEDALSEMKEFLSEYPLTELQVLSVAQQAVVSIVAVNEYRQELEQKLNEIGFNPCVFDFDLTAKQKLSQIEKEIKDLNKEDLEITRSTCALMAGVQKLKVIADYYKFLIEKDRASQSFRRTEKTFLLQGFLPEESVDMVKSTIEKASPAVFIEFLEPTKDDEVPVLIKNKNPVRQSEFVTDMYSTPNYKEIDPNKVVFFFFMLFMGVIMADIGYGILMIVIGLALSLKIKVDNGARRLWNIVAISGVSSIIFGVLFNSLFGFNLPYMAILPNPVPKNGNMDGLMTILLMCLALGVLHIATGYFLKAINLFKSKDVLGGIFEGLIWVIFFIGLVFATFNFLINYLMPNVYVSMDAGLKGFFDMMAMPGVYMVVGAVVIAMLTAGRNERGFGKFSKGFGAVYGIINIMSDILSYARLFGLMLSGMIIATTFNDIGFSLMGGGGIGYLLGGLVMVIGHVFNIAMGVLGAYIHNSRLQYIEFFGKFYSGEGNKFSPLGAELDYVYIKK